MPGALCVRPRGREAAGSRGVVLDPEAAPAAAIAAVFDRRGPVRIEDPFGVLDLAPYGYEPEWEMDVMVRPGRRDDEAVAAVEAVGDAAALAVAERTIVEGFPIPARGPGGLLAPALLGVAGFSAWIAGRGGRPAGAVTAFDDGASLGIYFLATLPEHRRRGVGAALLATAHASAPGRPAVLTATDTGRPLYAACGYQTAGRATWWWRST